VKTRHGALRAGLPQQVAEQCERHCTSHFVLFKHSHAKNICAAVAPNKLFYIKIGWCLKCSSAAKFKLSEQKNSKRQINYQQETV
jgi:hypothetical protein